MADSVQQSDAPTSITARMAALRQHCVDKVGFQTSVIEDFPNSIHKSMRSILERTNESISNQAKLEKLKSQLREEENALVKALAEKTRREAKRWALMDSLSATRATVEELERLVREQKERKDKYTAIIAQQCNDLVAAEEKKSRNSEMEEVREAISWYNKALGFQIECGQGVKFTFTNINPKNPKEKYFFTVRHSNDTYTLLDCDPHLDGIEQLVLELNKTNGLFKLVRVIRGKFVEALASGCTRPFEYPQQEASVISISAPVSSVSTHTDSETPLKENKPEAQHSNSKRASKKLHGRGGEETFLSPASLPRRSPRLKQSHKP